MSRQDPAALARIKELVIGLNRCMLTLCVMVEHLEVPGEQRALLSAAFGEAKAAMWDLSDALHITVTSMDKAKEKRIP